MRMQSARQPALVESAVVQPTDASARRRTRRSHLVERLRAAALHLLCHTRTPTCSGRKMKPHLPRLRDTRAQARPTWPTTRPRSRCCSWRSPKPARRPCGAPQRPARWSPACAWPRRRCPSAGAAPHWAGCDGPRGVCRRVRGLTSCAAVPAGPVASANALVASACAALGQHPPRPRAGVRSSCCHIL
jgi:hypothetical protein